MNGLKQLRHQITGWAGAWTGGPALSYHGCCLKTGLGSGAINLPEKKSPLWLPQWVGGTDSKQANCFGNECSELCEALSNGFVDKSWKTHFSLCAVVRVGLGVSYPFTER